MHPSSGDIDKRSYFLRASMVNTIYITMLKIIKTKHFDPAIFPFNYPRQVINKMWTLTNWTTFRYNETGRGLSVRLSCLAACLVSCQV